MASLFPPTRSAVCSACDDASGTPAGWDTVWAAEVRELVASGANADDRVRAALQKLQEMGTAKEAAAEPVVQQHEVISVLYGLPDAVVQPLLVDVALIMDLFWACDKDRSGSLEPHEFCTMMMELGSTYDQATALFNAIDHSKDGLLSLQELVHARNAIFEELAEREEMSLSDKSTAWWLVEQLLGRVWRIPQQLGGSLDCVELSGEMTTDRYIFRPGRILDFNAHFGDLEGRLSRGVDRILEQLHYLREDLQQMALKGREIRTSQPDQCAIPSVAALRGRFNALSETLWISLEGARVRLEPFAQHHAAGMQEARLQEASERSPKVRAAAKTVSAPPPWAKKKSTDVDRSEKPAWEAFTLAPGANDRVKWGSTLLAVVTVIYSFAAIGYFLIKTSVESLNDSDDHQPPLAPALPPASPKGPPPHPPPYPPSNVDVFADFKLLLGGLGIICASGICLLLLWRNIALQALPRLATARGVPLILLQSLFRVIAMMKAHINNDNSTDNFFQVILSAVLFVLVYLFLVMDCMKVVPAPPASHVRPVCLPKPNPIPTAPRGTCR